MDWQDIATAPKDGTRFWARGLERIVGDKEWLHIRRTWWGKVSHVPFDGWCYGSDPDLWQPIDWQPDPKATDAPEA